MYVIKFVSPVGHDKTFKWSLDPWHHAHKRGIVGENSHASACEWHYSDFTLSRYRRRRVLSSFHASVCLSVYPGVCPSHTSLPLELLGISAIVMKSGDERNFPW